MPRLNRHKPRRFQRTGYNRGMPIKIEQVIEGRRAVLASLTIGQLAQEYTREFKTTADIATGKGALIERMLLKVKHELEQQAL